MAERFDFSHLIFSAAGEPKVGVPTLVASIFDCSRTEATKVVRAGRVKLDTQVNRLIDLPVDEADGKMLEVAGNARKIILSKGDQ